jgi:hypothetical protein
MTEDEIGHVSDKLLHDTADSVKKDIAAGKSNSALQRRELSILSRFHRRIFEVRTSYVELELTMQEILL